MQRNLVVILLFATIVPNMYANKTEKRPHSMASENIKLRNSVRYRYFDEYLLSISTQTENRDDDRGTKTITLVEEIIRQKYEVSNVEKKTKMKGICCLLGKSAGDEGYHCNARFYKHRITMRNKNRSQTRQKALEDIRNNPLFHQRVWRTFGKCVEKHAKAFHSCCYTARLAEKTGIDKYLKGKLP